MKVKNVVWFYLFCGILILTGCHKEETQFKVEDTREVSTIEKSTEKKEQFIYVYVCGKVKNPGVYKLEKNARVHEALMMAGGVLKNADAESLNQAEYMEDGQTIYVPDLNEKMDSKKDDLLNINEATLEEMMTLPSIGESKANLILEYRNENGNFKSIEDLMDIPGIKQGVFDKIKDKIKVK